MDNQSILTIILFIVNLIAAGIIGSLSAVFTIGQYKNKVDTLKEEKDKARDKIDALRSDVDKLTEFKANAQKFIDDKIYQKGSPLNLTEFGIKLLKDSGFDGIFKIEKDNLAKKLEQYNPITKYDVQERARELMDGLVDYAPFSSIKIYAFSNGIDFSQILRAGAIPLRDYYFEKHLEITK